MLKSLTIFWNSFKMSLEELRNNKLRSGLSLIGIAFGIFCIIGVLATVNSLNKKLQDDVNSLGSNTIYIQKFKFGGEDGEFPWWKYIKRPIPTLDEALFIKQNSALTGHVGYFVGNGSNISYENSQVNQIGVYGVTEDFDKIQSLKLESGRYFSDAEFTRGTPVAVLGYSNAEKLFGVAEYAVGKQLTMNGKKINIIGVLQKQGNLIDFFNYDNCVIISYNFCTTMYNPKSSDDTFIMVQGKQGVATDALLDDLTGIMRRLRRLSPKQEDNFALNDVRLFTESLNKLFKTANIGGWAIAGLSLIVGAFGVANIMFVTVRERTSQIGLKKAIGAKKRTILSEFLLESAFLCIIGGLIGLLMVWLLTLLLSAILPFPIAISTNIMVLAFSICVVLGILSGIIPASIAARMNPVVAIRSTT